MRPQPVLFSLIAALCAQAAPSVARGQAERIHSYHSRIEVREDGSLKVTETIEVTAAGQKIRRGIYRDFPTAYKSKYLVKVELPFDVLSVTRDGEPEPYHTEQRANGVRVYVGRENQIIPRGKHTYEITYTTDFQLGFFETHDELYWNVTGNGWEFPIERASATVVLPEKIPLDQVTHEGYTGPPGSRARNLTSEVNRETGAVEFATTAPLRAGEGLTVVVGFPKGYVQPPTAAERRALYLRAGRTVWLALGALLVVLLYYLVAWIKVGRDPPGGVIYPQYEPPLGLPPACVRFLRRMGYDKKCFTAALLNMAVKGYLVIEEKDGEYTLKRTEPVANGKLSPGERAVANKLLRSGSVKLKQSQHKKISGAIQALGERLATEYEGKLFMKNRRWLVPGWLLSAAALAVVAASSGWHSLGTAAFLTVWLAGWTVGCTVLAMVVVAAWHSALSLRRATTGRLGSFASALFFTAFAVPFFFGEIAGLAFLAAETTIWIVPLLLAVAAINLAFWYLIRQPTVEGQRVMDEIEGFRMYLGTAEREYLQRMHPPAKTPELFEKYLPYALALGVENEWAEKFSLVLAGAAAAPGDGDGYHPMWYRGAGWHPSAPAAFAGGLAGALGGAISSSSTAPGSSSGRGGGGFSGGGGGGGGGGGW